MRFLRIGSTLAATLLAALFVAPLAHAALTLQVQIDTHTEPAAGAKSAPPDEHHTLLVTLADKLIIVRAPKKTLVYDFTTRKRFELNPAQHSRVEYSLYDTAGFRWFELVNRSNIREALAAGSIKQTVASEADDEHDLAFQVRHSTPLQESSGATDNIFSLDQRELWRRSLAGTPASPDDARLFAQFVRYSLAGHPQALAELAASKVIPERIVLTLYNVGVRTSTVLIKPVQSAEAQALKLDDYAPRQNSSDPLDQLLDRAALFTAADIEQAREQRQAELTAAWKEGRPMDAWLGILELDLMGAKPPALTPEERAQLQALPALTQFSQAAAAHSKDELANALKAFAELRLLAPQKAYMIDIMAANDRAQLGERAPAREALLKALSVHPFIAGAYKDLGDMLLLSFDMPRAWRCWDAGRRIAPAFANFRAVDQLEHNLAEQHSEYF